jgi:hypothetical protein
VCVLGGVGFALSRKLLGAATASVLGGLARVLAFPVIYIKEQYWACYFGVFAVALAYALYTLVTNAGTTFTLLLLTGSGVAVLAGAVYHLVRHQWAGWMALSASAVMIALGVGLLHGTSDHVASYNGAMAANAEHQWELQNKLLDRSISSYEGELRANQLWKLVFPEPDCAVAARAHFHKANGLLQSPNKGKEAYLELCKSLMRNSGNRYFGLTVEQAARREDDARHAQRNLEKLIRTGQDGGAGQPNGKQGQGQGEKPGPKRDPGKEPQPSSGREPRNSL